MSYIVRFELRKKKKSNGTDFNYVICNLLSVVIYFMDFFLLASLKRFVYDFFAFFSL